VLQRLRSLASPPAFFLATAPGARAPRLLAEDERHARKVLRLKRGALVIGLDGRGHRWPLRVKSAGAKALELESAGPIEEVPVPGATGSICPWIEVAVSWPRRNRVEPMLSRLAQLGASAILPLDAEQRGPEEVEAAVDPASERSGRIERILREACKQCGRAWLPVIEPARTPAALAEARRGAMLGLLEPRAALAFDTWLRSIRPAPIGPGTRERPIVLVIGPEGGFTSEERKSLKEAGASPLWLGPHVLRVETAAEAAMAIAAAVHATPPSVRDALDLEPEDDVANAELAP
jgi:16S rRNA (uracil1498-N3)-methyltransferase